MSSRHYRSADEKLLFLLSRGRCYKPECQMPVVLKDEVGKHRVMVQIAHVYGRESTAARHVAGKEGVDDLWNLLLLCKKHHDMVDDGRRRVAAPAARETAPAAGTVRHVAGDLDLRVGLPAGSAPGGPYRKGQRSGSRTVRQGNAGEDVGFVQRWIGPARTGAANGYFGPRTDSAVRWYQRTRGITVDGIVGPATWAQMRIRATGH